MSIVIILFRCVCFFFSGGQTGAARILQALARDNLIPILSPFAKGSEGADEPRRAVILTYFIPQACLLIGDLNAIAGIISNFFLLSFCMTNFACFVLRVTGRLN